MDPTITVLRKVVKTSSHKPTRESLAMMSWLPLTFQVFTSPNVKASISQVPMNQISNFGVLTTMADTDPTTNVSSDSRPLMLEESKIANASTAKTLRETP